MYKKLKKICCLGYDAQILESCRSSLDLDNLRTMGRVSWLLLGLLVALLAFYTAFDNDPVRNLVCFVAGIALIIIMFFCYQLLRKPGLCTHRRVDFLIDMFSSLSFAAGIYLGTFAADNDLAVVSVWMFFFVVLIFNRFPLRNFTILLIAGAVFTYCSFITKDTYIFRYDTMHAFTSIITSLFMAWSKSQMKVENILALNRLQEANLEILETVEEQQREAALLRHRANRDELTGLYKRHAFETAVADCLQSDAKGRHALICTDVDNFKTVNDSFGHMFGDTVLKSITEAICVGLPENSVKGRFGGDEFLIFVQGIDDMDLLTKQLNDMLENCHHVYGEGDKKCTVSLSAGIALYPRDGRSYTDLFKSADKALYRAKSAGKGRLCF